ncbi:uncharacterized protein LOC122019265 [Zingiber officinale]|uniref:uncharacterized protein LOC122019265 n=1 Tax=Zingiber officinale TaxID=94328 RepID=UPI001C4CC692|nr:uncharacterized protein LOC122019265 [Zingiber officinale]
MHSPSSDEVNQPPSQMRRDKLTLRLAEKERELERMSWDRACQLAALHDMGTLYRLAKSRVHAEKAMKEEYQSSLQHQLSLQERLQREHETEISLLRACLNAKQDTIAQQQAVIRSLHAELARALNAPEAPEFPDISSRSMTAILRSFASQEKPSVVVLQALNEELTQGLSSDPATSVGLQPLEPQTSNAVATSTLIEPSAPSPADSALLRVSDRPATEPSPAGQVPSPPPTMNLRLEREGKRVAPVTATSPPPPRRQRVVGISSPSRSSDTSLAQEKASDLGIADLSLEISCKENFLNTRTCSASLSAVQQAAELQRENAVLKASLRELEPLVASSTPPEPSLGNLDVYLRAAGESTSSARANSHAAFDKLQKLEAALKTSESSLASEAECHRSAVSELKNKEAELLSRSAELTLLRQSQELLQIGLADAQALALASVAREVTMQTQWETCQATLQSLQADLLKAQEAASQGQSDLSVARAEAAENKNSLEVYQAGEPGRLKVYRLAYIRSSLFLRKLGS